MWETLYKAQMWLMLETCVFLCYISLERQTKEIVFSQIEIITIVLIRNILHLSLFNLFENWLN